MNFFVSVIIPAFNVERFIEKTVASALKEPEVLEVVVINDGSFDRTEYILNKLQNQNPTRIKVYHHENGLNRGRSASRNLGIRKSRANFVAFLDSDDFYLPSRFKRDKAIFEKVENTEVVYSAVGYHFYRELKDEEKENFKKLNTVSKPLEENDVFKALISSKYGYLHLNGLTVRKSVFEKIGFFNEALPVAEDSDFIFKLGFKCKFKAGLIDTPVAIRGIHDENIYDDKDLYKKWNVKLYESLLSWCYEQGASINEIDSVLHWLWLIKLRENSSLLSYIFYWIGFNFRHPQTILSMFFIKYFPVFRLRQKLFPFLYSNVKNIFF
jgi:glycosyltransferase involved in cell wall biosynthesis